MIISQVSYRTNGPLVYTGKVWLCTNMIEKLRTGPLKLSTNKQILTFRHSEDEATYSMLQIGSSIKWLLVIQVAMCHGRVYLLYMRELNFANIHKFIDSEFC